MRTRAFQFRTTDQQLGVSVDEVIMERILQLCRETGNVETGGILVGHYTKRHDWAIVTDLSGPPIDSNRRSTSFHRGVKGLQTWLHQLWESKRIYYLGEWHYHPFASPEASSVDRNQLKEHSETVSLRCPEPIMLIFGGNPDDAWQIKAYVQPKGKDLCDMNELD